MLLANSIIHGDEGTKATRDRHPDEDILGVQLTGSSPEQIARAIAILDREGFDTIDINMGCPVRKIVGKGYGSALLRNMDQIYETVLAAWAATNKPLSVKVRLGYSRQELNIQESV